MGLKDSLFTVNSTNSTQESRSPGQEITSFILIFPPPHTHLLFLWHFHTLFLPLLNTQDVCFGCQGTSALADVPRSVNDLRLFSGVFGIGETRRRRSYTFGTGVWTNVCSDWSLLPLSHFSRVRLCATPSLGFSRQEHWSGLPFPSPMHKSEKWKWSRLVMADSLRPHGLPPTRLLHPWDFPGKSTGVGCHCLLRDWSQLSPILFPLMHISGAPLRR